jgi:hypothetical protein
MMRRIAAILVLACLCGCSAASPDPRVAACQAQAQADPTVQAAILRANSPLQEVRIPGVRDQKIAFDRALRRCLGGNRYGVDPVQPSY